MVLAALAGIILSQPIVWILGALGVTTAVGAATGFLVPLVTAIFLSFMGMIFLARGVEALAASRSQAVGGMLIMFGMVSFVAAISLINPGFLEGQVVLSAAGGIGTVGTGSMLSMSQALAVTPIEETVIGSLADWQTMLLYAIIIYGFYFIFLKKGKRFK